MPAPDPSNGLGPNTVILCRPPSSMGYLPYSPTLRFRDPLTFHVEREIVVRDGASAVAALNELEFVEDALFANVWRSERVARIDPASGAVTGWLDLSPIAEKERSAGEVDVANGIAWDGGRLFVTGKLWRSVYALELLR